MLLLSVALIGATVSCSPQKQGEAAKVVLVTQARAPVEPGALAVGAVRATEAHDVPAQNGGRVVRMLADVGQQVHAGQVLALLEDRAESLALSQAKSEYLRLKAVAVERGRNLQRMTVLAKASAVSQSVLEGAQSDARASAEAASAAKDAMALAQRNLDLTVIKAPVDGVVASRLIKLSDLLAAGTVAFEVDGNGAREITATTDEATAAKLAQGSVIAFHTGTDSGTARLVHVGDRVAGGGARDIRLQILTGNPHPGTVVELQLQGHGTSQARALVPLGAIAENAGSEKKLFVVGKDLHLRTVPVQLVSLSSAGALVDGAVKPGDAVVTAGTSFLQSGMAVRPIVTPR